MTDVEIGRLFHTQFETLMVEPNHADDDAHDAAVGAALRMALAEYAPEAAVTRYNQWAETAGYVPVRYLGMVDGRVKVDIMTAVIEVDDSYQVRLSQENACQP